MLRSLARRVINFRGSGEPIAFILPSSRQGGGRLSVDELHNPALVACIDAPQRSRVGGSPVFEFRGWVATATEAPAKVSVHIAREGQREYVADLPRPDVLGPIRHHY